MIVGKNVGASTEATLHNVKIFNQSQGEVALGDILDSFDAIAEYHIENNPQKPKIVCIPWTIDQDSLVDQVVINMLVAGIIVICAAGNKGVPITSVSPASVNPVITVGAFNRNFEVAAFNNKPWNDDEPESTGYVNYGAALDIFALGVDVTSPAITGDTDYTLGTGTSIAAGIVAGITAHYLEWYPEKTSLEIKEILVAEGAHWGRTYLVFEENENVDYSSVFRSIASTENTDTVSLTEKPSGRLINVKLGNTAQTSLGLNALAENIEVLDFAPSPPWIQIDLENDVITVDTVSVDENFPGAGLYVFAIRGDIDQETYVEEFSIGVYESDESELTENTTLTYYFDSENGEYDGVLQMFTLGKS
jgi:subtilisin family serine protease